MDMKEHEVIISLASNENPEANMAKAREQLTQFLTEVHFTSAIWTVPIHHSPCNAEDGQQTSAAANNGQCSMAHVQSKNYLNQLCQGTTAFGEGLLCEVLKETEKRLGRTKNENGIVAIDLDLLQYDNRKHHLRDWERNYVKDLIREL